MAQDEKRKDNAQRADPGQQQRADNRSESLLPGDDANDGRYDVAEEVNLDQQSDQLRRVGKAPEELRSVGKALKDLPKP